MARTSSPERPVVRSPVLSLNPNVMLLVAMKIPLQLRLPTVVPFMSLSVSGVDAPLVGRPALPLDPLPPLAPPAVLVVALRAVALVVPALLPPLTTLTAPQARITFKASRPILG